MNEAPTIEDDDGNKATGCKRQETAEVALFMNKMTSCAVHTSLMMRMMMVVGTYKSQMAQVF